MVMHAGDIDGARKILEFFAAKFPSELRLDQADLGAPDVSDASPPDGSFPVPKHIRLGEAHEFTSEGVR
jgi:hypothetical protein